MTIWPGAGGVRPNTMTRQSVTSRSMPGADVRYFLREMALIVSARVSRAGKATQVWETIRTGS